MDDIEAATNLPAGEALLRCHERSTFRFGFFNREDCFAIGGVEPDVAQARFSLWLVGTDQLTAVARAYGVRQSRTVLHLLTRPGRTYFNFVKAENRQCRRWLRTLGFTEGPVLGNFRGLGQSVVEVTLRR